MKSQKMIEKVANHRLQLTGCARVMMLLSVWNLLSAGGRQLSLLRYAQRSLFDEDTSGSPGNSFRAEAGPPNGT
ncbi:hypothetical protein Pla111_30510 [Botrimarina hoheduenensis]|uniref:Uncharacterized protein n=1 Tax=Botrimarina hoheduenensis TaxID=2528000 RepID=A0A5C5VT93_9BACT|nr:hypothetical protein Pla111_30510 [Botrimarina hoheduenensis]